MTHFALEDGTTVKLTLQPYLLNKLKAIKPDVYKNCWKSMGNRKNTDPVSLNFEVIYGGYMCGMLEGNKLAEAMDYNEFLKAMPDDLTYIMRTSEKLMSPKGKRGSEMPSGKPEKNIGV